MKRRPIIAAGCIWQIARVCNGLASVRPSVRQSVCLFHDGEELNARKNRRPVCRACLMSSGSSSGAGSVARVGVAYAHSQRQCCGLTEDQHVRLVLPGCPFGNSNIGYNFCSIFTARRYASAVYVVFVCPSVCLSVCLSVCHKPALYQNGYVQDHTNIPTI